MTESIEWSRPENYLGDKQNGESNNSKIKTDLCGYDKNHYLNFLVRKDVSEINPRRAKTRIYLVLFPKGCSSTNSPNNADFFITLISCHCNTVVVITNEGVQ